MEHSPDAIEHYAPLIQGVLLEAYRRRFELIEQVLPHGSIECHFANPDIPNFVVRQQRRMQQSMDSGSRYVAVHIVPNTFEQHQSGHVVAIGKATPSRPRGRLGFRTRSEEANCFVNDLASSRLGVGAGSVALHALLTTYQEDREVVLDAYGQVGDGAPENAWFRRLGFVLTGKVESPVVVNGKQLPQFRMGGVKVGEVRRALTQRHPWLANSGG